MSVEKRQQLIDAGLLDPVTGVRKQHIVTAEEAGVSEDEAANREPFIDAEGVADIVVAETVDPLSAEQNGEQ